MPSGAVWPLSSESLLPCAEKEERAGETGETADDWSSQVSKIPRMLELLEIYFAFKTKQAKPCSGPILCEVPGVLREGQVRLLPVPYLPVWSELLTYNDSGYILDPSSPSSYNRPTSPTFRRHSEFRPAGRGRWCLRSGSGDIAD